MSLENTVQKLQKLVQELKIEVENYEARISTWGNEITRWKDLGFSDIKKLNHQVDEANKILALGGEIENLFQKSKETFEKFEKFDEKLEEVSQTMTIVSDLETKVSDMREVVLKALEDAGAFQLAGSAQKRKKYLQKRQRHWTVLFMVCLLGAAGVLYFTIYQNLDKLFDDGVNIYSFLVRFSFVTPFVWGATVAQKTRSEIDHEESEFAYNEYQLIRFQSFSERLKDDERTRLLDKTLETTSRPQFDINQIVNLMRKLNPSILEKIVDSGFELLKFKKSDES